MVELSANRTPLFAFSYNGDSISQLTLPAKNSFPFSNAFLIDDSEELFDKIHESQNGYYPPDYYFLEDESNTRADSSFLAPISLLYHKDKFVEDYSNNDGLLSQSINRENIEDILSKIRDTHFVSFTQDKRKLRLGNKRLDMRSEATGTKIFSLLYSLIDSGKLGPGSLLILDEPESHLHPQWINKLAEIVVLVHQKLGVSIVLSTHSPFFLIALDTFCIQNQIKDKVAFYYGKNGKNGNVTYEDCSSSISTVYSELFSPFFDMNALHGRLEHEAMTKK